MLPSDQRRSQNPALIQMGANDGRGGGISSTPGCAVAFSVSAHRRAGVRILEHLRILKHRNTEEIVGEILRLREEIWRIEAEETETPSVEMGGPQGH